MVITENAVTATEEYLAQARELAEAVATLTLPQLLYFSQKRWQGAEIGSALRCIFKDLFYHASEIMEANFEFLQKNAKPGTHKVRGHDLFMMYQLVREFLDESLPQLNQKEAEHIRNWFAMIEEMVLMQNLPMIWSQSNQKALDLPFTTFQVAFMKAMNSDPSADAKRLWADMLELVQVLGGMAYANSSFMRFISWCSYNYGEFLHQQ